MYEQGENIERLLNGYLWKVKFFNRWLKNSSDNVW